MIKKLFTNVITIICVCTFCFSIKSKTALGKAISETAVCKKKPPARSVNIEENKKDLYPYDGFFIKI